MNNSKYKVVDGISFGANTNSRVIDILLSAIRNRTRIRLFYGDATTGRDWCEIYDTIGYIGQSRGGQISVPLLIATKRSWGGGALSDSSIVKITIDKKVVYEHPSYHLPSFNVGEDGNLYREGDPFYCPKNLAKAQNELRFLQGFTNKHS